MNIKISVGIVVSAAILISLIVAGVWFFLRPSITIPADWKSYTSTTIGFLMRYEPTLTLTEDGTTSVRFYKKGPSQRGQTEMFDGIILSVRRLDIKEDWQSYIATQVAQYDEMGTITEPLSDGSLNGIPVKEFSASSLGSFKLIYALVDEKTLLEISYMAPDPTRAGFQSTTDMMLSTFRLYQ